MHNTGYFPDYQLLSAADEFISKVISPDIQRHSKKPIFKIGKMEVHVHLKNAFPSRLDNRALTDVSRILHL